MTHYVITWRMYDSLWVIMTHNVYIVYLDWSGFITINLGNHYVNKVTYAAHYTCVNKSEICKILSFFMYVFPRVRVFSGYVFSRGTCFSVVHVFQEYVFSHTICFCQFINIWYIHNRQPHYIKNPPKFFTLNYFTILGYDIVFIDAGDDNNYYWFYIIYYI